MDMRPRRMIARVTMWLTAGPIVTQRMSAQAVSARAERRVQCL